MKKISMTITLILALCFTFSCQQVEKPVVDVSDDIEVIKAWHDQYTSSIKAGDTDSFFALYTENIVWLPPDGSIVQGKDAIRKWFPEWFIEYDTDETVTIQEVEVFGNHAFARGSYDYRLIHKESGNIEEGRGRVINLFERQSDGLWKCTHNIWTIESKAPPEKE